MYNHQEELFNKRKNCILEAKKYSEDSFELFFDKLLIDSQKEATK